jgi:hypothetical protein
VKVRVPVSELKIGDIWLQEQSGIFHFLIGVVKRDLPSGAVRLFWLNCRTLKLHTSLYPTNSELDIITE